MSGKVRDNLKKGYGKPRKGLGAQESINRHLEKLEFGDPKPQKRRVNCKSPRCGKIVQLEYTKAGYCMACVEKALKVKAEREYMKKIEREAMKSYDDNNFGLF